MKIVHTAVKEASTRITTSPWGHYLTYLNFQSPSSMANHGSAHGGSHNVSFGSIPAIAAVQHHSGTGSNSSVPSTPLSAALGPAAVATIPSKGIASRLAARDQSLRPEPDVSFRRPA